MKSAINGLEIYREAMDMGEENWMLATAWDFSDKETCGKQILRSPFSHSPCIVYFKYAIHCATVGLLPDDP